MRTCEARVVCPFAVHSHHAPSQHWLGEGDCGGGAVCATCHVHVPTEWIDKTGKADSDGVELSVLEYEENFDENKSRLSCQIELDDKLDGLIVEIPHK